MTRDVDEALRRMAPALPLDPDGLVHARSRVRRVQDSGAAGHARRRWWLLAPAVAAASAIAVALSTSTAPPAFATWTPVPTRPSAEVTGAATDSCLTGAPGRPLAPVLAEQRGQVVLVLLVDGSWASVCLWSDAGDGSASGSVSGSVEEQGPPPTGSEMQVSTQIGTRSDTDGAWAAIHGRVGPDVTRVVVARDDGEPVTATVQDGRFSAWWPGTAVGVQLTAYGSDERPTGVLDVRP